MISPEEIFAHGLMDKKAQESTPVVANTEELKPIGVIKPPTSRSIFSHPEAHPIALDMILLKHFDLDWLTWLPETLFSEIEQTFKTSIADINRTKILAAQTLHVTDVYWDQWEIFEKVIWSLNGVPPQIKVMQPPDLPILFAGVDMANSIREEKYGEEVARYCAAVFLNEHVQYAPAPLDFCQIYLADPYYVCSDCGKKGSALPPFDGLCSSCGEHYESEHPLSLEPDPDAVKRGAGKNVKIHLTYDPSSIKARFEELEKMTPQQVSSSIKETPDDIQAAKLITAVDFMEYKSKQLSDQISNLKTWLETP